VVIIALFIRALIQNDSSKKTRSLIASIAWFAIAWAYMGRTFGLIMAFDKVAAAGDIAPSMLAGGLKMALVGPLVGLFAFIIARIFIIVLIMKSKKTEE
jgi:mannose/fructose/N-acetylgalactosamine-specific phosphotransferase system component IID